MSTDIQVINNDSIKLNDKGEYTITDANGKTFDVSLSDIIDASTNPPSNDLSHMSDVNRPNVNFSTEVIDSDGVVISDSELLDSVKSGEAIALDVTFEATHSGENLNNAVYTSASLERDASTWMFPYPKPLIKNHDLNEEPIGRVIDTSFDKSEFCEDKDTINVTFRVSDADAMTKFADGRYKTMSIGARSGYIRCNICGKDILKDEKLTFCGHWRGNVYAGKKATWTVENMTFREGSIVNTPADVYAQAKRIKVVKRKEGSKVADNKDNSIIDDIDGIIDGQSTDDNVSTEPTQQDANNNTPIVAIDNDDSTVTQDNELEAAKAKVKELEDKVSSLTTNKDELEAKLLSANDSLTVALADNEALSAEVKKVKDQARRMAEFNLDLMKDKLMLINPSLSDAELEGKKAKEIRDMIEEAQKSAQTRQPSEPISSPGLKIKDKKTDVDDDNNDDDVTRETYTMKDMEKVVLDIWAKH